MGTLAWWKQHNYGIRQHSSKTSNITYLAICCNTLLGSAIHNEDCHICSVQPRSDIFTTPYSRSWCGRFSRVASSRSWGIVQESNFNDLGKNPGCTAISTLLALPSTLVHLYFTRSGNARLLCSWYWMIVYIVAHATQLTIWKNNEYSKLLWMGL